MSDFKITGNPTPEVGKEEFYSVNTLLPKIGFYLDQIPSNTLNNFEYPVTWEVYVLELGKWRKAKGNEKKGSTVSFTFLQRSLTRKGIRIVAKRGEQIAQLDIKTHPTEIPKIQSVELLDKNGKKPSEPLAYGQTIKARVHCLHMDWQRVYVTLCEDDADGGGHDKLNEKNKAQTLPGIVKNGIADIDFILKPDFKKIANARNANEGQTHEYYATAEMFLQEKVSSNNLNVKNSDYQKEPQKQTAQKTIPAENKGKSKKDKKEIQSPVTGKKYDWVEEAFKIKPIFLPDPMEFTNSVMKIFVPDAKDEKKGAANCVCKEYDLIWGNKVSCDFRKKVVEISKSLWPNNYKQMASGLMAVMRVETSETFSPSKIELVSYVDSKGKKRKKYEGLSKEAINKLDENFNGAVGLIQFTKDAIEALNKENSLSLTKKKLALMTDLDQLEYVKKYFMLYNWYKNLLSPEDIYLQVFAPIGIAKKESYILYEKHEKPETEKQKVSNRNYEANKSVDEENNNDKKIQRSEILGRYRISFAEGLLKKEKEFSCGANKNKEETSSDDMGVLDEMKALVDKNIPYSQLGVRNSLSEKGLEGLDCSETVSIYLAKLGITTSVKEINTGVMTNQKDFRKAIDSENIDFITGSDSNDFKPSKGDIFVWRRSDGVGHTGIVYSFDEETDLVTILEAIGNVGSADETTNKNNGGYSGTGSSRTAIYKRSGKALSKHAGWKGYFRPKNYTKKL
ncbi:CHAP domain-containing protein [Flavobacterium flavigenum]|uniref:CHAP domain-containing protein n=1 Tax=Flavobacterium flavigenum TaxID=3003258 RepID=UPI002482FD57|nr:CHAP domain-containing protein [Flavobacterium flavigenum]